MKKAHIFFGTLFLIYIAFIGLPFFRISILPLISFDVVSTFKNQSVRNYFEIISVSVNMFLGIVGLIFGYIYFSTSKERALLQLMVEKVETIDSILRSFYSGSFENQRDITSARSTLFRSFDEILTIFECEAIKVPREVQNDFIKVYSFADKSEVIRLYSLSRLRRSISVEEVEDYFDLIRKVKVVLVRLRR
jgi:hypothetical protein